MKDMKGLKIIGTSTTRLDALQKVTGSARYATDVEVPRMLHAKVLRSPHPHARIKSIDARAALKLPGVRAVVTQEDTLKRRVETIWRGIPDKHAFAVDRVRYVGEEIAAVAAEDELTAEEAVKLIKVKYEVLAPVFDPEETMNPGAPQIHDAQPRIYDAPHNTIHNVDSEFGDVEKAFRESDYVLEDRFSTQYAHPCNLEPTVCIASFDSFGELTFCENSTDPFRNRVLVARALGMDPSKVRIIQEFKGGGFGHWQMELAQYVITALLAQKTGRPVKFLNTREEELSATRPRGSVISYLKTGVRKDGTLVARDIRVIYDCGAYAGYGPIMMMTALAAAAGLYKCANVRLRGKAVYTNTVPTGPSRNFGTKGPQFATESQMDIIAHRIGVDPVEIRLKNSTRTGETTIVGQKIDSCGFQEGLQRIAEYIGRKDKKSAKKPYRGIGIGCGMCHGDVRESTFGGSLAYVKILEDGRVRLLSGEFEWGQGAHTLLSMIVAEELDVPIDTIEFSKHDSHVVPYALGPYGSGRVTPTAGQAVRRAAIDAREKLFTVASQMLGVSPDDVEMKDRKLFVKQVPAKVVSLADVASYAKYSQLGPLQGEEIVGKGSYNPPSRFPDEKTLYGNCSSSYIFTAQAAEVEVDPETGQVTVLDYVSAVDLGNIINPMAAEGQVHGGVATELGYALMEEMQFKDGHVINPNFTDYRFPTALDVPRVTPIFVETNDPNCAYGAKGGGAFVGMGVNPAMANAIYDAVGVRIKDLPITPMKILAALKEKQKST